MKFFTACDDLVQSKASIYPPCVVALNMVCEILHSFFDPDTPNRIESTGCRQGKISSWTINQSELAKKKFPPAPLRNEVVEKRWPVWQRMQRCIYGISA